jgi:hypothetical protein
MAKPNLMDKSRAQTGQSPVSGPILPGALRHEDQKGTSTGPRRCQGELDSRLQYGLDGCDVSIDQV